MLPGPKFLFRSQFGFLQPQGVLPFRLLPFGYRIAKAASMAVRDVRLSRHLLTAPVDWRGRSSHAVVRGVLGVVRDVRLSRHLLLLLFRMTAQKRLDAQRICLKVGADGLPLPNEIETAMDRSSFCLD